MSPEQWNKLSPLLDQALDLSAEEQARFLQQLRADDPELCQQVESLLKEQNPTERLAAPPSPLLEVLQPAPSCAATLAKPGEPAAKLPEIAGYEVLELLGRGGQGWVYKARQIALNRLVVLKMIRLGAQANEEELQRFRTEALAVAHLQHPNVVQIYEIGENDGQPYFSAEYIAGGSLDRFVAAKPPSPRFAAEIVEQLARAMQFAHARGILHRDLKPANVLLASGGCEPPDEKTLSGRVSPPLAGYTPKITDFGLAKRLQVEEGQTQTGAILGTPSYMAPEQAQGQSRHVRAAADIYALGAILYEMLTGRPPFRGDNVFETLRQVIQEEPIAPRKLAPAVPRDLETICLKCLEKRPERRYATALTLAEDLRLYLAGRPITARPLGLGQRSLRGLRRQPVLALLMGVILALALGAVFWRWGRAETPGSTEVDRPHGSEREQPTQKEPANAEQRPRPNGRLIFQDRFDTRNPLPVHPFNPTDMRFENVNGTGRLRTTLEGIAGVVYINERAGDFAADYEFQVPNPLPESGYGFFFRGDLQPTGLPSYYLLLVSPKDEMIRFECLQDKQWTQVSPFGLPPNLVKLTDTNTVRLEARGSEFRIFLNGTFFCKLNDDKISSPGVFGFFVQKKDRTEDIVYYSNLHIHELGDTP